MVGEEGVVTAGAASSTLARGESDPAGAGWPGSPQPRLAHALSPGI